TTTNKRRRAPVWDPEQHPGHRRAVWAHSQKRATLDGHTLTAQETRARAVIDADAAARSTRLVKTTASGRTLDTASLERARRLVGLKGYVTNSPATVMRAAEVFSSYHHAAPDAVRAAQSRRPHPADPHPGSSRTPPRSVSRSPGNQGTEQMHQVHPKEDRTTSSPRISRREGEAVLPPMRWRTLATASS